MHLTIIKNERRSPEIITLRENETRLFFQDRFEVQLFQNDETLLPRVRFVPGSELPHIFRVGELSPPKTNSNLYKEWVTLKQPITVFSVSDSLETDEVIKIVIVN